MTSRTMHAFDTLIYAKKLKKAGFTDIQAEAQASALADVVNDNLATKQDIRKLEQNLKNRETRLLFHLSSVIVGVGTFLSGLVIFFR